VAGMTWMPLTCRAANPQDGEIPATPRQAARMPRSFPAVERELPLDAISIVMYVFLKGTSLFLTWETRAKVKRSLSGAIRVPGGAPWGDLHQ
jgi:hypothetical protein